MNSVQMCTARALEEWDSDSPKLVILSSAEEVGTVRNVLGMSLDEAVCRGRSWRLPDGRSVRVGVFTESPTTQGPFTLAICNGGRALTSAEAAGLKVWREASRG